MTTPYNKKPCPGSHKIYNLEDPSLVIITIYIVCLIHAPEKTRRGQEILLFHDMAMSQRKNPAPGS